MIGWVCWTWVSHCHELVFEDGRVHECFDLDDLTLSPLIITEEDVVNASSNPSLILNSKLMGGDFWIHQAIGVSFLYLLDLEEVSENTLDLILDWWVLSDLIEISTKENWLILEVVFEEFNNNF